MDRATLEELRHLAGVASRPLAETIRKAHDLQKHGDHDQSTHGNRHGGQSSTEGSTPATSHYSVRQVQEGDRLRSYKVTDNGTHYSADTPEQMVDLLEQHRQAGTRVQVEYGDRATGQSWGDVEAGTIRRSTGDVKIPLLVHNQRSMGGPGLLDSSVVRLTHASKERGGVIYQHPTYKEPKEYNIVNKHGDHDQSTHGNRGGMSRAEGDPGRVDRTSGAGGFLTPPGHPEQAMHVQTDLNRRPENRGSASLSYAAQEATGLHPSVRDEAKRILQEWEKDKKPLSDPEVKDWTHQVLGYFRNMRIPESGSRNVSDLVVDPSVDSTESADRHAGVAYIRQYYPDYTPAKEDFEHAYWGRKPEKVMKHGDHDQSTHGHRGAESAATEPSGGRQRRENIQIGLRERADILRNRVHSDITDSHPVGRLSELGEALAITSGGDPAGPGLVAHGTPLGTLIWNAKGAPSSEQVAEWNQRWQESEQFERDALAFNYAVIEDNRTIGNQLVMEQGARLKERGLLDPDEAGVQGKLEAFWNKYPDADSGLVRGSTIEPIYHKKPEKVVKHGDHDQSTHGHRGDVAAGGTTSLAEDEHRMLSRMVAMERERTPRERVPLNGSTIIGTYGPYSSENANQAADTAWKLAEQGYLEIDQAHPNFPAYRVRLTDKGRELAAGNKAAEPGDLIKVIRHEGDKWVLHFSNGRKEAFDSEEAAQRREQQIQYFKHTKKSVGDLRDLAGMLSRREGSTDA